MSREFLYYFQIACQLSNPGYIIVISSSTQYHTLTNPTNTQGLELLGQAAQCRRSKLEDCWKKRRATSIVTALPEYSTSVCSRLNDARVL
jgi:hypothetical protein